MSEIESKKLFLSGIEHFKQKNFFLAVEKFEKALVFCPERVSILENLAIAYFKDNEFQKCEDILNKLIELGKDSLKIFDLKFKVLKKLDKIKEEIEDIGFKIVGVKPSSHFMYIDAVKI